MIQHQKSVTQACKKFKDYAITDSKQNSIVLENQETHPVLCFLIGLLSKGRGDRKEVRNVKYVSGKQMKIGCNPLLEGKFLYRTLKGSKALHIWNP